MSTISIRSMYLRSIIVIALLIAHSLYAGNTSTGDHFYQLGRKAYSARDYSSAITYYTQSIDAMPSNAEAYRRRGDAFAEKTPPERDRAMLDYERAITLNPQQAEFHFVKGILHREMGDIELAITEYGKAIVLRVEYIDPLLNRAELLISLKRYNEAIEDLKKVIQLDKRQYRGYYWRAYALYYSGDERGAIADFEEAIKRGVKDARFYNDYAWVLATSKDAQVNDTPRAIKLALKAITLVKNKDDLPKIYDTLAVAYDKEGKPELSQKYRALAGKKSE